MVLNVGEQGFINALGHHIIIQFIHCGAAIAGYKIDPVSAMRVLYSGFLACSVKDEGAFEIQDSISFLVKKARSSSTLTLFSLRISRTPSCFSSIPTCSKISMAC